MVRLWQHSTLAALLVLAGLLSSCQGCGPGPGAPAADAGATASAPLAPEEPEATREELQRRAAEAAAAHKAAAEARKSLEAEAPARIDAAGDAGAGVRKSANGGPAAARQEAREATVTAAVPESADQRGETAEVGPAGPDAGPAQGAPVPGADAACAQCHAALVAGPRPHEALRTEGCSGCHAAATDTPGKCKSAAASHWKLTAGPTELCLRCHQPEGAGGKPHGAAQAKGCTACHEAHSSQHKALLKQWPLATLCASCHKPPRRDAPLLRSFPLPTPCGQAM